MIRTKFPPKRSIEVGEKCYCKYSDANTIFKSFYQIRKKTIKRLYRQADGTWHLNIVKTRSQRAVKNGDKENWGEERFLEKESKQIQGCRIYRYMNEHRKRYFIALHEAGHFVAGMKIGRTPKYASITPNESSLGHVQFEHPDGGVEWQTMSEEVLQSQIIELMAGAIAENKISKICDSAHQLIKCNQHTLTDYSHIKHYINCYAPDDAEAEFTRMLKIAEAFVDTHFEEIKNFADQLVHRKKITYDEYREHFTQ